MADVKTSVPARTWVKFVVIAGLMAALAAGALWMVYGKPSTSKYDPIISAIASHQLEPEPSGKLVLSGQYAGITPKNEMFVLRNPDGSFLALFPTYYPKGPAIMGLLYTSRPFGETDTFNHGLGVLVIDPYIAVPPWGKLRLDRRVDNHWYEVSQGVE